MMNGNHTTSVHDRNTSNGMPTPDTNLIKSLLANKVRSGIQQNNHMPLLQVDGAGVSPSHSLSPTDKQSESLDLGPIMQVDGAGDSPPSSPTIRSRHSPQVSPQARVLSPHSPRAHTSPHRSSSKSPHLQITTPPISPHTSRSPKAKYNLEVCVQAAKAAEVVPENHQKHEKKIERVENHCSPSKLDMNAGLVKQLQGGDVDILESMDYEIEAPRAEAVSVTEQTDTAETVINTNTSTDGSTDNENVSINNKAAEISESSTSIESISDKIEVLTAVKNSQTCTSELEESPTIQSNAVITADSSHISDTLDSVKADSVDSKDNNKLLAAIKGTLNEDVGLLKKTDTISGFNNSGNGIKQQLINGLNENIYPNNCTVGMVFDKSGPTPSTQNNQVSSQNTPQATTFSSGSMLAAQLTGQLPQQTVVAAAANTTTVIPVSTLQYVRPPAPQNIQTSTNTACATNSMGQSVVVRIATPQNLPTVTSQYVAAQPNTTISQLNQQQTAYIKTPVVMQQQMPLVNNSGVPRQIVPAAGVLIQKTPLPTPVLNTPVSHVTVPYVSTTPQQMSLSSVMSAVSQSHATMVNNSIMPTQDNKRPAIQDDPTKKPCLTTGQEVGTSGPQQPVSTTNNYVCQWNHCKQ